MTQRREFIKNSALGSAGIVIGGMGFSSKAYSSIIGANERINMAVIGIRNQGSFHINNWCGLKDSHNVVVKTICDADERLFKSRSKIVSDKTGVTPLTQWDMRKVFDDKDIHGVSIVTPSHWHALATIWACQAGKHVYVEKPVSHNIFEGRKMVEAGIKYKRHIQHGASPARGEGLDFVLGGGIGKVYMVRVLCLHRRDSYGFAAKDKDTTAPDGFHYDMWLGPAPERPYNPYRSHYCWHWYWDTGCGDTGNTGPHAIHSARTGIQKNEQPVYAVSNGGVYGFSQTDKHTPGVNSYGEVETFGDDRTTQETPNIQNCVFKYSDGTIFEFEERGRYTNTEGTNNISDGIIFYGTEGYMEYTGGWKAFRNFEKQPIAGAGIGTAKPAADRSGRPNLFTNFLDVIRSGKDEDLINPILGGHYGASLVHLANISYRLGGRSLNFDNTKGKFINDPEADKLLTRPYRKGFVVPDKV